MLSMQSVSQNCLIGTFQLSSAASMNLGWSQNGVLGNGLNQSKIKGFADDKIILTQKLKFVLGRIENIVRKVENAGY